MNKYDPDSVEILLAIDAAAKRHPKPEDGPVQAFPVWQRPLVKANTLYGTAVAYTHSYGLIMWTDESKSRRMEWFEALPIKRVEPGEWHGH